jgi:hypothetical protein
MNVSGSALFDSACIVAVVNDFKTLKQPLLFSM